MRKLIGLFSLSLVACSPEYLFPLQETQFVKPPETITIEIKNYIPTPGKEFRNLFVSNFSVKAEKGSLLKASARDSQTDDFKKFHAVDYGFIVGLSDSNSDGFSDLVMYLTGMLATQQASLFCGAQQRLSSSNDLFTVANDVLGLRDCEKNYLNLDPSKFDYDNDSIPDYLELRCGLNPRNPVDANISISGDGMSSLEKCKRNIPVDESSDTQPNSVFAYRYKSEVNSDQSRIFRIANIPVLDQGKDNFIAFYLEEFDSTTKEASLFTAYAILTDNSAGKTLSFDYWPLKGAKTNQELKVQ